MNCYSRPDTIKDKADILVEMNRVEKIWILYIHILKQCLKQDFISSLHSLVCFIVIR